MAALNPTEYAWIIPATSQFLDINGKPLVGGYCVIYIHGTTGTPYTTYQNWEGTENPIEIPIDVLGHAPAIGSVNYSYDLYVYDSLNALVYSRLNLGAYGDEGTFSIHTDSTLHGDGSVSDPLGVEKPEVIGGLVRGIVPESDNVHVRTYQYLSDGSIMVGLRVDQTEYQAGPGIKIEDNVISLEDLGEFEGSLMVAEGSATSGTDLNTGMSVLKQEGDSIFVQQNVLKLNKGVYHVDAFIRFGAVANTHEYDLTFLGHNGAKLIYTFDNTYEHSEVINFSFDADIAEDNTPLTLTLNAASAPSAYSMKLEAIHIMKVIMESGIGTMEYNAGAGIEIDQGTRTISTNFNQVQKKLTAGDHINIDQANGIISAEQEQADWNQTDTSADDYIKNKPDMADYAQIADLAAVAFSGAYSDLSGTPDLSAYVPTSAVCPNWVSGEAVSDYTYRWYNGKVYRNLRTYAAGSSYSIVRPDSTVTRIWVEVPVTLVGNTLYHYFSANPSLSYNDIKALIGTGYNLVFIGNDSTFNSYGKAFTLIGEGPSYSSSIPYPYYCFAALKDDGSGMIMRVVTTQYNSQTGNPMWYSPSASFGKVYTAGTGISLTGPNNTEINCTLDPFPAHTAADAGKIITVGGQNQLLWRKLSYSELSDKPTQVQSDWDQSDDTQVDFIKNKPNAIPIVGGTDISIVEVDNQLVVTYTGSGAGTGVDDVTVNGSSVLNANHVAVIDLTPYVLASSLAAVATSGAYSDLSGTPDLSVYALISSLAAVATSGDYTDLTNKPDLSVYALAASLAAVATSGSYADLSNKPDLSVYALASSLAAVATSGDYNDLSNKPTIPTITYTTSQEVTDILADLT